jgi:hypothetical protein
VENFRRQVSFVHNFFAINDFSSLSSFASFLISFLNTRPTNIQSPGTRRFSKIPIQYKQYPWVPRLAFMSKRRTTAVADGIGSPDHDGINSRIQ